MIRSPFHLKTDKGQFLTLFVSLEVEFAHSTDIRLLEKAWLCDFLRSLYGLLDPHSPACLLDKFDGVAYPGAGVSLSVTKPERRQFW